jgi:hypothetical protein
MQDRTGKYPQMINTCHEIIKLQPDIPEAYYFLGCAHMNLDQYKRQLKLFRKQWFKKATTLRLIIISEVAILV